jgi:hypothetical protein
LELDYPDGSGTSLRAHLLQVEEATGVHDDRVDGPLPPEGGETLWQVYWELRREQPLTLAEIEAYCRLTGQRLESWEVRALRAMDGVVQEFIGVKAKPKQVAAPPPQGRMGRA